MGEYMSERVKIRKVETLSDDWYVLKKTTFDYLRNNGEWQTQSRETYDRGNGATILLYNLKKSSVVLSRQFRLPAFVNGLEDGLLIEAVAGLLDEKSPEKRIIEETKEEIGYEIRNVEKIFEAYMSPGSVTEKLYFFVAEYNDHSKVSSGGGVEKEGEDIEVLELSFDEAIRMVHAGEIRDGKTIMLLQYAALNIF